MIKINGITVKELLDDYSGRDREIQNCKNYRNDDPCVVCDADRVEMGKIVMMIELSLQR